MTADFAKHHVGRVFEARRLGLQRRCIEKPGFDTKHRGSSMDCRFVRFEIQRIKSGDRIRRDIACLKRCMHQGNQFRRVGSALTPHAHGDALRVINQMMRIAGDTVRCGGDSKPAAEIARNVRVGQKWRQRRMGANRCAGQQVPGKRLHIIRIAQRPAGGRVVECDAKTHIPCRGHGGNGAERCSDILRQIVRTVMTAQQRDNSRSILGNRDNRRLRGFIGQAPG